MSHTYIGGHRTAVPDRPAERQAATVRPTFTPARVLFLLVVGPIGVVLTALLIQFSPNAWVFHTMWGEPSDDGMPTMVVTHAQSGVGR